MRRIALLLLLAGCTDSVADKCRAHGMEPWYTSGKYGHTVCIERRADGFGVLVLPPTGEQR